MYVTLEHSRRRINPGFHSQSSQSKILKKIPDFLQNAAKQIVPWERTTQKLPFEWSQTTVARCGIQFVRIAGCQHPKGILYYKEDILLPRKSVFFEEFCLTQYFAINRFLPANVTATPTPTPKKKFDLKASLAKPLPYKPHTGKLKPLSTYKEECRPTLTEAKLKGRRVDVKSTKVTSR